VPRGLLLHHDDEGAVDISKGEKSEAMELRMDSAQIHTHEDENTSDCCLKLISKALSLLSFTDSFPNQLPVNLQYLTF